jgi:hypothetical protein
VISMATKDEKQAEMKERYLKILDIESEEHCNRVKAILDTWRSEVEKLITEG